jgi:hypothetical protein
MRKVGIDLADVHPVRLSTELAEHADCPAMGRLSKEVRAARDEIARRATELLTEL